MTCGNYSLSNYSKTLYRMIHCDVCNKNYSSHKALRAHKLTQLHRNNEKGIIITSPKKGCHHDGCSIKIPAFNFPKECKGIYCVSHKEEGMVDVIHKKCMFDGCTTRPSFNTHGQSEGIYCYKHKKPHMVNVKDKKCRHGGCNTILEPTNKGCYCSQHKVRVTDSVPHNMKQKGWYKKCRHENCDTIPVFNLMGETTGLFCNNHKTEGMVDVTRRLCKIFGCIKRPSYNLETETTGMYCSDHKTEEMVNVVDRHKKCLECAKSASFNFPEEQRGLYCDDHKKIGMINVTKKMCASEGCKVQPTFNYAGEKTRLYCCDHKKDGMVDVSHKRCEQDGCITRPSYNFLGETTGLLCFKHKKDGMINVLEKRVCLHPECAKRPNYNFPGENKGLFCFEHKDVDMVDINHKKCNHHGCNTRPNYNFEKETTGILCFNHKEDGMIDLTSKFCQAPMCMEKPIYGRAKATKPHFCEKHKTPDMINFVEATKCCINGCNNTYDVKYKNKKYCMQHHPNKNYEANLKKQCKYCDLADTQFICKDCDGQLHPKEWMVVNYIKKNIKTPFMSNTSQMFGSCSRKMPDVYFDLDTHCVVVEIDENQHKSYREICECTRLNEIVNGVGGRPVVFIRFNPDKIYNNKKEVVITIESRLIKLLQIVEEELSREHEEFVVELIQLYYDDNHKTYMPMKVMDITGDVAV